MALSNGHPPTVDDFITDASRLDRGSSPDEITAIFAQAAAAGINGVGKAQIIERVRHETKLPVRDLRAAWPRVIRPSSGVEAKFSLLPEINVVAGDLSSTVDQAEDALLHAECGLYQRAGSIVRPIVSELPAADGGVTTGHRIVSVTVPHVVECMTRAADFRKYLKSEATWVATDCPANIAEVYIARQQWRLPPLVGVVSAPTLRADGSILQTPGYDERTGLLFEPLGHEFHPIPSRPNRRDAIEALGQFHAIIDTFPFVAAEDRSVAISAILTALVRRSMTSAPLHAFTAPVAGSGKTMLVNIAATIASGRGAGVISQGHKEEEFEKRLASCLIAGDAIINVDNCEQPLSGDLLCQAISEAVIKPRVLGFSLTPDISSNGMIFATGNNLVISGDISRRALLCSLDPQCERPELREFDDNPIYTAIERRSSLVLAGLTILRAHVLAKPPATISPLGGFEAWSRMVRDALVWLGEPDPCVTIDKIRAGDTRLTPLVAVLSQWRGAVGSSAVSARRVIEIASDGVDNDFRETLDNIAGGPKGLSSIRLGKWLAINKNRVVDGLRIKQSEGAHKTLLWTVQ